MKIQNTKILITGGAGFIGKKLALQLASLGAKVIVFDCLTEQIHGHNPKPPIEFNGAIKFIYGNVLNYDEFNSAIRDAEVVIHLAAETGVGQSMYQISRYSATNIMGTANLLDILTNTPNKTRKIILASSRAIYGEGAYECSKCGKVYPKNRKKDDLRLGKWEPKCPLCKRRISFLAIDENCLPNPGSVYAISKYTQEQMIEVAGNALKIPYTILRFFNVYGESQALNNPYTGILSVFVSRILNSQQLNIFEDGLMFRDFIYIEDVVRSIVVSIENEKSNYQAYNVGTGEKLTVLDLAKILLQVCDSKVGFKITGLCRLGDVRHVVADISKISRELNFRPKYDFREGIARYLEWAKKQKGVRDYSEKALAELKKRKLLLIR